VRGGVEAKVRKRMAAWEKNLDSLLAFGILDGH